MSAVHPRDGETEDEASRGLVRGVCTALLIELVLAACVLAGMLIVAGWRW